MNLNGRYWLQIAILLLLAVFLTACGPGPAGEKGTEIISAEEALELDSANIVWVDSQTSVNYRKRHVGGAVNIPRPAINIQEPFPNLLAPPEVIDEVMQAAGIDSNSLVIVYDDNKNMDAARLWWTLKAYGHDSVKVVSGGIQALSAAGVEINKSAVSPSRGNFKAKALNEDMLATQKTVRNQIKDPSDSIKLVDTRSMDEYNQGTIPGALPIDYAGNNFTDGTFRPVQHIRIRYLEQGIDYNDTAILFCKTSIRGAQTYLALYNAGYRDIKLYDGAWVEWTANPLNPIYTPEPDVYMLESSDQS